MDHFSKKFDEPGTMLSPGEQTVPLQGGQVVEQWPGLSTVPTPEGTYPDVRWETAMAQTQASCCASGSGIVEVLSTPQVVSLGVPVSLKKNTTLVPFPIPVSSCGCIGQSGGVDGASLSWYDSMGDGTAPSPWVDFGFFSHENHCECHGDGNHGNV